MYQQDEKSLRRRLESIQNVIEELDRKIEKNKESISFNQSLSDYLKGEWENIEKELSSLIPSPPEKSW